MYLFEVPQDEIDRVLRHPLPTRTYPFDAVALRDLVARCISLAEEEKHSLIERFLWISGAQAAKLALLSTAEQAIFAVRNEEHVRHIRSTFHAVASAATSRSLAPSRRE